MQAAKKRATPALEAIAGSLEQLDGLSAALSRLDQGNLEQSDRRRDHTVMAWFHVRHDRSFGVQEENLPRPRRSNGLKMARDGPCFTISPVSIQS